MTKTEYNHLKKKLETANKQYRAGDPTEFTDHEYDLLVKDLADAEARHPEWGASSVTSEVGSDLTSGFQKVAHAVPMLSIDDVFERRTDDETLDFSEALEWVAKQTDADKDILSVEPKLDGCAMTLVYEDGILIYAATRGDGKIGDDITENAKRMIGVPHTIPYTQRYEVRGEAIMYREDFEELNRKQAELGEKEFANPRNLTAGTIKSLDPELVAERKIRFIAHGLPVMPPDTQLSMPLADQTNFCKAVGITSVTGAYCVAGEPDIISLCLSAVKDSREKLPYDIDGAVVKIESYEKREALGTTARAPRWACALKFLPEQKETTVRSISLQVGRTGNITPVANLDPVKIAGSTVARATLHNQDEINRLRVALLSRVVIEKAGDIIPAVVKTVDPVPMKPFDIMAAVGGVCPYCGTQLLKEEGVVAIKCPNPFCEGKLIETIEYMCSRAVFDITGIGKVAARALVMSGMVTSPLDVFKLTKDELASLDMGEDGAKYTLGDKMATKAVAAIDKARTAPLSRWLMAANISGVGKTTAEALAKKYNSFDELMRAATSTTQIVGAAVTKNIVAWFADPATDEHFLSRFPGLGINPTPETTVEKPVSSKLAGEVVVVTGTLSEPRTVFEKLIVAHGGTFAKSISGNTSLLLAGEKAGSKLRKAEQLGIAIITEEEFRNMIK